MTTTQVFFTATGLAIIDAAAASWYAGLWEAAVFAGLAVTAIGTMIVAAQHVARK